MLEKDIVTTEVQVLDILPGEPPKILTGERLHRGGKLGRLFQQLVPIQDSELFSCLVEQVHKGDRIKVTVTTEWYEEGYTTYLSGFGLIPEAVSLLANSSRKPSPPKTP